MSQIANIAVYDGAATPVLHTLVPIYVTRNGDNYEALWREQLAAAPAESQVYVMFRSKKLSSGVVVMELRWGIPVMEAVNGANAFGYTASPKVAFTDQFVTTGFQHPRSTITSRRTARMIGVNIANNIATSVAAASSGPASEMFDAQVLPT